MGAEKVSNCVFRVGGDDLSSPGDCCVSVVDGGSELCLIDTGCGPGFDAILANVSSIGLEPANISTVLLTHCHIDHVGAAWRFREELGASLVMNEIDSVPVESADPVMTGAFMYGIDLEPVKIDRKTSTGDETIIVGDVSIQIVFTPGHTPGSVSACFDDHGQRVLFAQDVHGPFLREFSSDIDEWGRSMRGLLELNADVLCEGHFGVYSPAAAARDYIESYLRRYDR